MAFERGRRSRSSATSTCHFIFFPFSSSCFDGIGRQQTRPRSTSGAFSRSLPSQAQNRTLRSLAWLRIEQQGHRSSSSTTTMSTTTMALLDRRPLLPLLRPLATSPRPRPPSPLPCSQPPPAPTSPQRPRTCSSQRASTPPSARQPPLLRPTSQAGATSATRSPRSSRRWAP